MQTIVVPLDLQKKLRLSQKKGKTVGFVPTMGALHEGHLELIRRAKRENSLTVVSLFVNPTQFGPGEDFKHYPRPIHRDKALLRRLKVDYVFVPSVQAMYPEGNSLFVDIAPFASSREVTGMYCGRFRPGHFRGVLTVCAKLLNIVGPERVYMGAKDYQQTVVIERLIKELHLGAKLVRVSTVREPSGLALSSRNCYLSAAERARALMISKTLFGARDELKQQERKLRDVMRTARLQLSRHVDKIDYFEAVDPKTLLPLVQSQKNMVLLTACYVGKTRLIDNVIIKNLQ